MIHQSGSCGHLSCLLKVRYRKYSNLPSLLVAATILFVLVLGWKFLSGASESSGVKDAALQFAQTLKQTQESARQAKQVLTVKLTPSSIRQPSSYCVINGYAVQSTERLPENVSGSGEIKYDPDGAPLSQATFVFRKGVHTVELIVDGRGEISFPESH
jgi:hypothetical protein